MNKYDVVIVGSGIGGLCCGSILALAGKRVLICEAHSQPGGVAHSFNLKGYKFESGPSLWSGLGRWPTTNPLGQILRLIDEKVELIKYQGWLVNVPEGNFNLEVGEEPFKSRIKLLRGNRSVEEWDSLMSAIKPLSKLVSEIPLLSSSPETINILGFIKLASKFLPNLNLLPKLNGGFGDIVDNHLKDPFLRNWVDLLSFLISGMPMHDTNSAAMATLFDEWFKPTSYLEYPKGGSESIVKALINAFKKNGGELIVSSKVEAINFRKNIALGVTLENGSKFTSDFVVLNTDIWTSRKLIPQELQKKWKPKAKNINKCGSFLHLHLGFDASGLQNLPIHSIHVDDWGRGITAERNVVVFSIPSVLDKSMAPKGKHVLHGYTPANEPWEIWENLNSNDLTYKKLKEERCSIFLKSLRKIIPDIDNRIEIKLLGTPLTHKKFTNTYCGSYGPALSAAQGLFPGCKTPIKNLLTCGASTFPGIGIPAVSASGAYAAEKIIGKKEYKNLLKMIDL
ncbi:Bacterial-type phytoene dehydrogenase [Prochlorococcus marinus str. MIT 9515]|uniref:Bacterial-type phytoene dehydrogenase n=1 Tax=Prochlorococcus marinus (strain MIT 9515) TaxID=167542 RepID=A2BUX2_PROM5|nr:NAD(P)/FAD-dependent oxidoreductase [Prochlorococcus marinus]ABM71583.1 Bacterial-type phytoene dehydrogenase [Prochlorococcus marinus str. MIT 9515]